MTEPKMNAIGRTLEIKAGMTPQDVINSDKATAQQKKMAYVFDSDGVAGYSQREADVFNATTITDNGNKSVSLWTRYSDGTKKETKYVGDVTAFKYAPQGDVKPYEIEKKNKVQVEALPQNKLALPPLTMVEIGDTLTFYSKRDSLEYVKKENVAWTKYEQVDNTEWEKYEQADNTEWAKYKQVDNTEWEKYEQADESKKSEAYQTYKTNKSNAYNTYKANKSNAYRTYKTNKSNAYKTYKTDRSEARNEHCSIVKEF